MKIQLHIIALIMVLIGNNINAQGFNIQLDTGAMIVQDMDLTLNNNNDPNFAALKAGFSSIVGVVAEAIGDSDLNGISNNGSDIFGSNVADEIEIGLAGISASLSLGVEWNYTINSNGFIVLIYNFSFGPFPGSQGSITTTSKAGFLDGSTQPTAGNTAGYFNSQPSGTGQTLTFSLDYTFGQWIPMPGGGYGYNVVAGTRSYSVNIPGPPDPNADRNHH